MSWLEKTLGESVMTKTGTRTTKEIAESSPCVGLYFSAHWCPPCRRFTPELAKWYEGAKKKGMEIIFLSGDQDQKQFDEYYKEMPWAAVPFENRALKAKLSKKFGVKGIPSFIILDPKSGKIHTKNGRDIVGTDPTYENFPWPPKEFWTDVMGGKEFVTADDKIVTAESLKSLDYIGFYFSAHWCPPCRGFTPVLAKWYEEYHTDSSNFEIIFNSWDKTEEQFNEYRKTMPFPSRKWDDSKIRKDLDDMFEATSIPMLVVLDAKTGKLLTSQGRAGVTEEPAGLPWVRKSFFNLGPSCIDALNSSPCCIAFIKSDTDKSAIESAMKGVADTFVEVAKAEDEWPGPLEIEFIIDDGTHELSARVKDLLKLQAEKEILVIMELSEKKLHVADVTDPSKISAEAVKGLVDAFKAGTSKPRALEL